MLRLLPNLSVGLVASVLVLGAAGCAPTPPAEMAATSHASHAGQEGGIGGTGIHGAGVEGGIGGTGAQAATGVFGAITGFGSLHVNGLRIDTGAAAMVDSVLGPAPVAALRAGDAVAITATKGPGGGLQAASIARFLPLVGPVSAVDGGLEVMGTPVILPPDAPSVGRLSAGDRVAVSGLWRGGAVVATRITRADGVGEDWISGTVFPARSGGAVIGATRLRAADLRRGAFATARGQFMDGVFNAAEIDHRPMAVFDAPVARLVVEGFLAPNPGAPGVHLSGFGLPFDPTSPIAPVIGERSVFDGQFDGAYRVETRRALPAGAAARQGALAPD